MANRIVSPDLRAEIKAAVARVIEDGKVVSKADLAREFQDRGIARSTIYLWIDRYLIEAAATILSAKPGTTAVPITEIAAEMVDAGIRSPSAQQFGFAIPFLEDISSCLRVGRTMIAMAHSDDGKAIRNVRIAAQGAEVLGRTLDRAARIGGSAMGREANIAFLKHMAEAVQEEAPDVRDRIISKINERTGRLGGAGV